MTRPFAHLGLFAIAALALVGAQRPAGIAAPSLIRIATLDGVRGPVYYSVVDARYHAVTQTAADTRLADLGN